MVAAKVSQAVVGQELEKVAVGLREQVLTPMAEHQAQLQKAVEAVAAQQGQQSQELSQLLKAISVIANTPAMPQPVPIQQPTPALVDDPLLLGTPNAPAQGEVAPMA
jgi:hypothetical protein